MQRISQFFPLEENPKHREIKHEGIITKKNLRAWSLAFDFKVAILDVFRSYKTQKGKEFQCGR